MKWVDCHHRRGTAAFPTILGLFCRHFFLLRIAAYSSPLFVSVLVPFIKWVNTIVRCYFLCFFCFFPCPFSSYLLFPFPPFFLLLLFSYHLFWRFSFALWPSCLPCRQHCPNLWPGRLLTISFDAGISVFCERHRRRRTWHSCDSILFMVFNSQEVLCFCLQIKCAGFLTNLSFKDVCRNVRSNVKNIKSTLKSFKYNKIQH